ncbi:MAG: primosomal protein N' [Clostridioides sp.]|jgi:primosomal protein N' (replication factor Y)|nr:primosomal protein N' [Clostridioides sp.]
MEKYAKVIVRNNSIYTDNLFTYRIPEELEGKIDVGCRVSVPFGKGNKFIEAFIFEIFEEDTTSLIEGKNESIAEVKNNIKIKNITEVLDKEPMFDVLDLNLINWMKNRYLCTYIECINLLYPKGYKLENYRKISITDEFIKKVENIYGSFKLNDLSVIRKILFSKDEKDEKDEEVSLKDDERDVIVEIINNKGEIREDKLRKFENIDNIITRLKNKGYIDLNWEYSDKENKKEITIVSLNIPKEEIDDFINENKIRIGKAQNRIIEFLKLNEDVDIIDLEKILSISKSSIDSLEKKAIIKFRKEPYFRKPRYSYIEKKKKIVLNEEQSFATNKIIKAIDSNLDGSIDEIKKPFVLKGVTGSGKTEVYLEVLEHALSKNLSGIFLVPEISLTPQMITRVKSRFGSVVGVFHSKLSQGQKHDVYEAIRRGEVKILVGARSALFAPFKNLGVIIIDEFHEHSYKSESNPKYNAIEVARYISLKKNVALVLGSATPSVEQYYHAKSGDYELIEINTRANHKEMPKIEVVDMRKEIDRGNISMFSHRLISELRNCIKNNNQAILFLNRRGYANFVSCKKCGYVFKCDCCDISLTYHKNLHKGVCHYCGREKQITNVCPECKQKGFIEISGTGTQKIEEELMQLIPNISILRMDKDTTSKKGELEKILSDFKNHKSDVLLGTQMLSKGLDFENVTLVGILSADMLLNFPDYKSYENTFQQIVQVAGRAGRAEKEGKVILQTYETDHYCIKKAQSYDFEGFYNEDIKIRQAFGYPPFNNIMRVVISGKNLDSVRKNIVLLKNSLEYLFKAKGIDDLGFLFGPNVCSIGKINSKYRWQILMKDSTVKLNLLKGIIKYVVITKRDMFSKDVTISIDVNPENML